ncbi:TIGR03619 family F420-dependent LLM class oxidoreductase [Nocardioides sp. 503]|uniref:TIGR03619 family F420-dependent LLM class oxidoreductase n=1 Tax=Nocardioides sp. 503 TaxID=2508326 RepID=UPI00142F9B23|nr:TIGR03619 family F420-dependent LLM class oxidoreductase [Nocardioides sp. 503]
MSIAIGAKLPHTGTVDPTSIPARARAMEVAGFDSLWVSDHVVMPLTIGSYYPFASDGKAPWTGDIPYIETVVTLAAAAAATEHVGLGSAVLVLPQRNPVLLAKQVASLDALSNGRISLGIGAGWLQEEFAALDSPFEERGRRMEEWIALLRDLWTGTPPARDGIYPLADGLVQLPVPPHPVPLLVGGHTKAAFRRAGSLGDGWLAQQAVPAVDVDHLATEVEAVRANAVKVQRDPADLRFVLRLVESTGAEAAVAALLPDLEAIGFSEVIIDTALDADPAPVLDTLRSATR